MSSTSQLWGYNASGRLVYQDATINTQNFRGGSPSIIQTTQYTGIPAAPVYTHNASTVQNIFMSTPQIQQYNASINYNSALTSSQSNQNEADLLSIVPVQSAHIGGFASNMAPVQGQDRESNQNQLRYTSMPRTPQVTEEFAFTFTPEHVQNVQSTMQQIPTPHTPTTPAYSSSLSGSSSSVDHFGSPINALSSPSTVMTFSSPNIPQNTPSIPSTPASGSSKKSRRPVQLSLQAVRQLSNIQQVVRDHGQLQDAGLGPVSRQSPQVFRSTTSLSHDVGNSEILCTGNPSRANNKRAKHGIGKSGSAKPRGSTKITSSQSHGSGQTSIPGRKIRTEQLTQRAQNRALVRESHSCLTGGNNSLAAAQPVRREPAPSNPRRASGSQRVRIHTEPAPITAVLANQMQLPSGSINISNHPMWLASQRYGKYARNEHGLAENQERLRAREAAGWVFTGWAGVAVPTAAKASPQDGMELQTPLEIDLRENNGRFNGFTVPSVLDASLPSLQSRSFERESYLSRETDTQYEGIFGALDELLPQGARGLVLLPGLAGATTASPLGITRDDNDEDEDDDDDDNDEVANCA